MDPKLQEKLKGLLDRGELEQDEFDQLVGAPPSAEEPAPTETEPAPKTEKAPEGPSKETDAGADPAEPDDKPQLDGGDQSPGEEANTPAEAPEPTAESAPQEDVRFSEFQSALDGIAARMSALEDAFSKVSIPLGTPTGLPGNDSIDDEFKDSTAALAAMKKAMGFRD